MSGLDASGLQADEALAPLWHRRVRDLSDGERRYLEVSLILGFGRPVTLLDEPFSQVEPRAVALLQQKIRRRPAGTSVVVADHSFSALEAITDQMVLLAGGRLRPVSGRKELDRIGYLPT